MDASNEKKEKVSPKKKKATRRPREVSCDHAELVEKYCQAILDGKHREDAYLVIHPHYKRNTYLKQQAYAFHRGDAVQARLKELREMRAEQHQQFRDTLLHMLSSEIRECWEANGTLGPVVKQAQLLAQSLGMLVTKNVSEVNAKIQPFNGYEAAEKLNFLLNGGVTENLEKGTAEQRRED